MIHCLCVDVHSWLSRDISLGICAGLDLDLFEMFIRVKDFGAGNVHAVIIFNVVAAQPEMEA